jgi:hypothetical protein
MKGITMQTNGCTIENTDKRMGEIRSTLELAMERTKHLNIS